MSVEAGRLAAVERIVRAVAADVEAVGFMVGAGAAPLPWYAHLDGEGLAGLSFAQRDLLAAWHAAATPEPTTTARDGIVEVRMVTPTCGYLLVHRFRTADGGSVQTEWVVRDDLPPWPL